jgi:hypothetical protein
MDKFIQLSCYSPADVADDEEKQDHFRDGLIAPIKYLLMVHTFENFQKMVDNTIMVEHARKEIGEQKMKFESPGQFSNNSCPRFVPPKGHLTTPEDRMSTSGRINTSAPISRTSSSWLNVLVSQCSALVSRRIAKTTPLEHV